MHELVSTLPLVSREAKKRSWPDANAGWMLGVPPSVPSLPLLYLEKRKNKEIINVSNNYSKSGENSRLLMLSAEISRTLRYLPRI